MNQRLKNLLTLHILFAAYSFCGVLIKFAARQEFLSFGFIAFYAGSLIILAVYSLVWQRILRIMPLTTAFSNKGVTVIWGIIWGLVLFGESITLPKVIAAVLIVSGIAVMGSEKRESTS
ncbi:MAG: transporter [Oscillospiraceae bacterium]|jgi:multidrug transporter EmrE-like cation transporter|nr:transporter [Oscillospiraceae bacterium]